MEYRRFQNSLILRVQRGEELIKAIANTCKKEKIQLAEIHGIGAMEQVQFGLYQLATRSYQAHEYQEMLEMVSLDGNVTEKEGQVYLHLHAAFGREDGTLVGGHLNRAVVGGTAEIFIHVIDGKVDRAMDEEETGLNLMVFQ